MSDSDTEQKMKFSITDFFSKCDQIRRKFFVQCEEEDILLLQLVVLSKMKKKKKRKKMGTGIIL